MLLDRSTPSVWIIRTRLTPQCKRQDEPYTILPLFFTNTMATHASGEQINLLSAQFREAGDFAVRWWSHWLALPPKLESSIESIYSRGMFPSSILHPLVCDFHVINGLFQHGRTDMCCLSWLFFLYDEIHELLSSNDFFSCDAPYLISVRWDLAFGGSGTLRARCLERSWVMGNGWQRS